MVSTRHHPRDFPAPTTPGSIPSSPPNDVSKSVARSSPAPNSNVRKGVHTPSAVVLVWLLISVPLVIWDSGYIFLRPHSMPGGKFHSPIWSPYALYGTVDYVYGWPAFNARNGFTAAQGALNIVETAAYIFYLAVVYLHGTSATNTGRASTKKVKKGLSWFLLDEKVVPGRIGGLALIIAFSASIATLSKTVLYWLNELFSGFDNIGHNNLSNLVFLWIIPNGLWLIFPTYMIYVLGGEILYALEAAAPRPAKGGRVKSS
ncbi:hypothetical protein BGW36DRAFT_385210 [Talaromyces proteolyticus]|uniref:C6 transcription factor n=1 Tax=Talaromyces proteolyticus TaxID=1131652 RepID=A0AAD4PXK6_9EURO|nr:uncharacterized protein BGW36DRAFT_385210 [Talaromyces proteolyticus]KAH8692823.1 hypothetical protein BGW36DRAFT_385210 [Talaromyces proteolyticus]